MEGPARHSQLCSLLRHCEVGLARKAGCSHGEDSKGGPHGRSPGLWHSLQHTCAEGTHRAQRAPSSVCRSSFVFSGGWGRGGGREEAQAAVRRQAPPSSSALNLLCDSQQATCPLWPVSLLKCQTGVGLYQVTPSRRNMLDSQSGAAFCPLPWVRPPWDAQRTWLQGKVQGKQ